MYIYIYIVVLCCLISSSDVPSRFASFVHSLLFVVECLNARMKAEAAAAEAAQAMQEAIVPGADTAADAAPNAAADAAADEG